MGALSRIPSWVKRLDDLSGNFTNKGIDGLAKYPMPGLVNRLCEMVIDKVFSPDELEAWINERSQSWVDEHAEEIANSRISQIALQADPRIFWSKVWNQLLGKSIFVPPVPKIKGKTKIAIERYKLILVFLPVISEADYPESFVKPNWGRYITEDKIERKPLPGRWVLVETIAPPCSDSPKAYGHGEDVLMNDLKPLSRFEFGNFAIENIAREFAKLLGLPSRALRLPTIEERNLIGNLFLCLNANMNMDLPDLGSGYSWEACLNKHRGDNNESFVVGLQGRGGLANVDLISNNGLSNNYSLGYRLLAVL
ncbi:hypothetical protein HYV69_04005 [Candidatus Uhrbacteria bacterium]|nr:hypothetical protein [Candidatus Uhrbacteria bacterium]